MQALLKAKDLLEAIQTEELSATRRLLVRGANPNLIIPDDGISPFHLAVGIEHEDALDFVKLMLKYGGNPNVRSTEGMTPTLIAAAYGRYQALCVLLDNGGDPTITDDSGKNALDYARSTESWDCIKLLKEPWERQLNHMGSTEVDGPSSSNDPAFMDSEDTSVPCSFHGIPEKVISETYLAAKQGFDVTSPDNPLWFFKGSPGSTVIECSGLDQTLMYPRTNTSSTLNSPSDLSNSNSPSSTSNLSNSLCHDLNLKRLSFNDSACTCDSGRSSPAFQPPSSTSNQRNNSCHDSMLNLKRPSLNDSASTSSGRSSPAFELSSSTSNQRQNSCHDSMLNLKRPSLNDSASTSSGRSSIAFELSSSTSNQRKNSCHDSMLRRLSLNDSASTSSGRSSPVLKPPPSGDDSADSSYIVSLLPSINTSSISTASSNTSIASNLSATLSQIVDENSACYLHKDSEASTILIEKQCPSASTLGIEANHLNSFDSQSSCMSDSTISYDWKQYSVLNNTTESFHEPVRIPGNLLKLSDKEIRQQLTEYGYNVGPITNTTRMLYLKKLRLFQTDPKAVVPAQTKDTQGFKFELSLYVNGHFSLPPDIDDLEQDLIAEFTEKTDRTWREGKHKTSFNYLLLDPRVTKNLPLKHPQLSDLETFTIFSRAIFYVGKGKRSRPYMHFNEAIHHMRPETDKAPGAKVSHILDIWAEGHGVVSLHVFQNVIPVEAYTREACMMHAIGLQRLTNSMRGNFYGTAQTWTASQQRVMGIHLLIKACKIFLVEGERQIRPGDIAEGQ